MIVVAAYDVANDRRRQRLATYFESRGARVQLSVFECEIADHSSVAALADEVEHRIDPVEDQVRLYVLDSGAESQTRVLGQRRIEERQDYYIV